MPILNEVTSHSQDGGLALILICINGTAGRYFADKIGCILFDRYGRCNSFDE